MTQDIQTQQDRDSAYALREEHLPFTVRLVQDEVQLAKALHIRQSAYGRHVPDLARRLGSAERCDSDPGAVILLAESKLDGAPLGTMRIQSNRHYPLLLEQSVTLPEWLRGRPLAEATRLGVAREAGGRLAKVVLFKAYFLHCLQTAIEWMVVAGRSPLDRQYAALLFQDVFPEQGYIPMAHAGNIPHRVLAFEVNTAERRWREARHPLYDFVFRTRHPDLHLNEDV